MKLNELAPKPGSKQAPKRVGRGMGSGTGKTAGSGQKGQKARSGVALNGFEGGQNPLYRRLPKRGFVNIHRIEYQEVTTGKIQEFITSKKVVSTEVITKEVMVSSGLVRRTNAPIKLLVGGELSDAINIEVDRASKAAVALIEKNKGSVKQHNPSETK
jgi:large subunit ribosomal protein L15